MTLTEDIVLKLKRLRETGVSISIDDFGTGYSSLSYLKHLPVNKIKIDRSFVMDIVSDPDDAAIVDAIISIARTLHLGVIAEGVESKDQVDFLIGRLCNEFQGYYFSKPLSHENFAELFRKGNGATPQAPLPASKAGAATGSEPPAEPSRNLYLVEPRKAPCPCENMRDVVELIAPVSPNDRIITVLGRFQQEKDLRLIPVVEEDVVVGVVNRSVFLEDHIIGRHGFGIHINHTKKIRDLMEPVEMTLDSEMLVENAAMHLQPMLGNMRIDNICISQDGKYLGVINISRFIKAMTEVQIVLAKGANPLTGLPGNTSIEREICKRLESGLPFEIAYFDMDNFKPFNDHYGFQKGDEVIQRLGEILTATVAGTNSFCGHIGGDDFILITDPHKAEIFCRMVIAAFEAERPVFHGPDDVASGGYRALNRKGELESFPLISLSVGIVNTSRSMVESYARLASLSTEVKKSAKKKHGSSIVIDGRSAPGGSPVRPLSSPDAAEPHRSVTPAAAANL